MTPQPTQTEHGFRGFQLKRLIIEALAVTVTGGLFALLANRLSPAGIELTRDYFPKAPPATNQIIPPQPPPWDSPEAQLHAKGLNTLPMETVVGLFASPGYAADKVIFVDARNDEQYRAGHIPGAFAFDHYRPETSIAVVFPACLAASNVVVYCTGGDCEESGFAALALADAGVPRERLRIYVGGITEWQAAGRPVETGDRRSGQFLPAKP